MRPQRPRQYGDDQEPAITACSSRNSQNFGCRHRRDQRRDDMPHPPDLGIGNANPRRTGRPALVILLDPQDDDPAGRVRHGGHIPRHAPPVLVRPPVEGGLEVQIEVLADAPGH